MAVLDIEGFEARSMGIFDLGVTNASIDTTVTAGPHSAASLSLGGAGAEAGKTLPAVSELWHGFRWYCTQDATSEIMYYLSPAGVVQISLRRTSTGFIEVRRGTTTVLATSTRTIALNRWYWIDVRVLVASAGGVVEVWIDEAQDISFTGNTQGDASTTSIGARRFKAANVAGVQRFDDEHIYSTAGAAFNGRVGDRGVYAIFPSASGDVTQLSVVGAAANWDAVNDAPPDDATSYVASQTLNAYDLYNLSDSLAELTNIGAVKVQMRAQKKEAGTAKHAPVLKYDTNGDGVADTEATGTDKAMSTSWAWDEWLYENQPDGTGWTRAKLDALQVGPKVR